MNSRIMFDDIDSSTVDSTMYHVRGNVRNVWQNRYYHNRSDQINALFRGLIASITKVGSTHTY